MREILRTVIYIFFPPYLITYILRLFDVISLTTELSVFLALFLNMINLLLALFFYNFSKSKSNQIYMIVNFGGMGLRILFLLLAIILTLIFLEIEKYAFILVFLIFYSLSIFVEIKHFNSEKNENKKQ